MNKTSFTRLPSKRAYLINIGRLLTAAHGKLAFYTPEQIEAAHKKTDWIKALPTSQYVKRGPMFLEKFSVSAVVAAMSIFSTHADFDKHMLFMGGESRYSETRTEILSDVLPEVASNSLESLNSHIDVSWLDVGEGVGAVAEGVGEVFAGLFALILEGLGGIFG